MLMVVVLEIKMISFNQQYTYMWYSRRNFEYRPEQNLISTIT